MHWRRFFRFSTHFYDKFSAREIYIPLEAQETKIIIKLSIFTLKKFKIDQVQIDTESRIFIGISCNYQWILPD